MVHARQWSLAAAFVWTAACNAPPKTETATMGGESAAAPAALSAEDEAAVRAVDDAWAKAATAGDGKAVAALYSDDAVLLPPMESAVQGEAARKYWTAFTDNFTAEAELKTTTVEGRGDLAYSAGTYRMTITPKKAGAKPMPTEEGKYLEVLKKQADGSWKITHDIWNQSAPAKP